MMSSPAGRRLFRLSHFERSRHLHQYQAAHMQWLERFDLYEEAYDKPILLAPETLQSQGGAVVVAHCSPREYTQLTSRARPGTQPITVLADTPNAAHVNAKSSDAADIAIASATASDYCTAWVEGLVECTRQELEKRIAQEQQESGHVLLGTGAITSHDVIPERVQDIIGTPLRDVSARAAQIVDRGQQPHNEAGKDMPGARDSRAQEEVLCRGIACFELMKLTTHESVQGHGIGTELVAELIRIAAAMTPVDHALYIRLYSSTRLGQALRLYKRFGFEQVSDGQKYETADIVCDLLIS
eukprot:TRINITY_DN6452_c0_g1_i1.p1 TRINITY_DN6452_c0_g1~~TRINITY_DN6452_c0_g1_i1.p1  ORF type:complete len:324 (+),score=36.78 TRINITY_DN6452_c0_g1_i1:78-974(+)